MVYPGTGIVLPGLGVSVGQTAPSQPKWYHVAWVSDGSTVSTYFNGQLSSKVMIPAATPFQRKYNEVYYKNGSGQYDFDDPYNVGYGIGGGYGKGYGYTAIDGGMWGHMRYARSEGTQIDSSDYTDRIGMSMYRFTANKALYSGASFNPPAYIDSYA